MTKADTEKGRAVEALLAHFAKPWTAAGFAEPTAIQKSAWARLPQGGATLLHAPTGSGKTLAYLLPLLARIQASGDLQLLIVLPAHELASQVKSVVATWGRALGLSVTLLVGGANRKRQRDRLKKKPEMVVGTPGRLLEFLEKRQLNSQELQAVVLDEADQLLAGELWGLTSKLLGRCPGQVPLVAVGATTSKVAEETLQGLRPDFSRLDTMDADAHLRAGVAHGYLLVPGRKKAQVLRSLAHHVGQKMLVFGRSQAALERLGEALRYHHLPAWLLHSGRSNQERQQESLAFEREAQGVLLTTDVGSRGLDLPALDMVVNVDLPASAAIYLHRSGRVGRMGRRGLVLSLVTPRDVRQLKQLLPPGVTLAAYHLEQGELQPGEGEAWAKAGQKKKKKKAEKPPVTKKKARAKQKKRWRRQKNKGARRSRPAGK